MLRQELQIDKYLENKIRAFSMTPDTIDTILAVLEFKYDEDESKQTVKQKFMKCLMRLNQKILMQEYMDKLNTERQILHEATELYSINKHARKAVRVTNPKARLFDRLSKNALQNVMSFFEYKGTDFMKMRCVNRKTKMSYMQELSKKFNAERQLT